MTIKELEKLEKNGVVRRGHTSWKQGNNRCRINRYVKSYDGDFGKGYALHTPCWDNSSYHYVTYFIETKKK